MDIHYQEFAPSSRFASHIECFWSHRSEKPVPRFRVLPDGCSDIIFEQPARRYGGLVAVGTMTSTHSFALPSRQFTFGVRFRPAMGSRFLRVRASEIVDASIPLANLWAGAATRRLLEQMSESDSPHECVARIEAALGEAPPLDPVEKAIAWLTQSHGQCPVEDLADAAGLSPRQFRRVCLERTGLSPKRLARILRFRRAVAHAGASHRRGWAEVALECGYYDQAHLINEFREFTGTPPGEYVPAAPDAAQYFAG
jgi:AraC-like DNA-binding protein